MYTAGISRTSSRLASAGSSFWAQMGRLSCLTGKNVRLCVIVGAFFVRSLADQQLIRIAKEIYTAAGNPGSVIAGTGSAHSTREAILLCREAAEAGADFALVLPSSYYPGATDADAHQAFFEEVSHKCNAKLSWADDQVADESPIPIIIYSYPAVSSGIVLSTDLTKKLASHPNIVGIKHTDHEVGRIAREVAFGDFGSESLRAPTGSLLQLTASSIYHLGWRFRLPHRDTGCRWSRCHLGHGEYHPSRTGQDLRPLPVGQAGRGPQACRSHLALRMGHRQRWHARDQGEVF